MFPPQGDPAVLQALAAGQPQLWLNPRQEKARDALQDVAVRHGLTAADVGAADRLLRAWAPALQRLFPELERNDGLIESAVLDLHPEQAATVCGVPVAGRCLIKADHALPVAGSIKARGAIHEVLLHAQERGLQHGLWAPGEDPQCLLAPEARRRFGQYAVAVGSTGNLGMGIGIMAAALGFRAVVHMSHDAKAWKKARLRERGVQVIEHRGDYGAAVAAGRREAATAADTYFVDDENSRALFLGYAVAGLRLQEQLVTRGVPVDAGNPLFVYLPCGVGGAPGGVSFGLKHVYGDAVHCFFAEPRAAPAMLLRMAAPGGPRSVYDIGLDNRTEADGLACAQASELVYSLVGSLIAGAYTVTDEDLLRVLARLQQVAGIAIEPSAAAAFVGPRYFEAAPGRAYLLAATAGAPARATHLFWTTGGAFVPPAEFAAFYQRGCALLEGA